MSAPSEALHRRVEEAIAASGDMLERCLEKALTSLQDGQGRVGSTAHRLALADAWGELLPLCGGWAQLYPKLLRTAATPHEPAPRHAKTLLPDSNETLTLVEPAQVDEGLESARLLALLHSLVAPSLGELDRLVSSQLGLESVQPEQNPLRPAVYSQALRALLGAGEHPLPRQSLWLRHLGPALGAELAALYRRQADLLTQAGVQPVNYRLVASASGAAPQRTGPDEDMRGTGTVASGAPAGDAAGQRTDDRTRPNNRPRTSGASRDPRLRGGSAMANLSMIAKGNQWVRDFLRDREASTPAPLAPGYYARVASELSELEGQPPEQPREPDPQQALRYRQLPVVDRPPRQVSTDTPLDAATWGDYGGARRRALIRTQLKQKAQKVDQVLGLELVRKLLNQVAQDPRLLGPVREAIVALEPALLRMALVEPRFFSDDHHPGRCLIERVAVRSLRFNDEFSADFRGFLAAVAGGFGVLNGNEGCVAQDFSAVLAGLETAWAAQDALEEQKRALALEAVRFAEKRQVLANDIARSMSQRSDLADVPACVQEFLYGTWALVMAQARLSDRAGRVDPGAHGSVVTDLLWSVRPQAALLQPARLIELIPPLLVRLRLGLASLGQAPQESAEFFLLLERLHRPLLDWLAARRLEGSTKPAIGWPGDKDLPQPIPRQQPLGDDTPWMAQGELDAVGFQDTRAQHDSTVGPEPAPAAPVDALPKAGATQTSGAVAVPLSAAAASAHAHAGAGAGAVPDAAPPADPLSAQDLEKLMASLQQGCWVDLYSRQQWARARLAWASSKGTLFMFVSRSGQPHSMTHRICERLLRERLLRPVGMHEVVTHAIGVVARDSRPSALAST